MTSSYIIGRLRRLIQGVGAIKREPTPPGPITDLFARLDSLHSEAGRPSMREIARRAGRGNISSSTVHNIFRSSRVPRWEFLEHVVIALGTVDDRQEFLALWQAAWRAENELERPREDLQSAILAQDRGGSQHSAFAQRPIQGALRGGIKDSAATHRQSQRIWSNEIPPAMPISQAECPNWRSCTTTLTTNGLRMGR